MRQCEVNILCSVHGGKFSGLSTQSTTYHEPCKHKVVYASGPQVQDHVIGPSFSRSVLDNREVLPVLLRRNDLVKATSTRDPGLPDILCYTHVNSTIYNQKSITVCKPTARNPKCKTSQIPHPLYLLYIDLAILNRNPATAEYTVRVLINDQGSQRYSDTIPSHACYYTAFRA